MSKSGQKDSIYDTPQDMIVDFVFDESVAHVFPDMIRRSVPGYDNLIPLLGIIAEKFVTANSNIYDLGCSLGASTLSLRRRINSSGCKIIAVDNAEAMVEQCRENIANDTQGKTPVDVICDDIRNIPFKNTSLAVMNFTLQFISPDERLPLLSKIATGMNNGGALILSEKIIREEENEQALLEELQLNFKRANGYSELEISQKRAALDNVLIPDTIEIHRQRLTQAGFSQVVVWQQCLNFVSLLAIK
ncbi:MAG: carboxy-S-adenosyl-L-methionine synthase CmoA [Sulfuriflexus sp.]|nr:carboxy-S-adenosyl-L-methionine synthase CmoA [Sulfuriflexus sp.]